MKNQSTIFYLLYTWLFLPVLAAASYFTTGSSILHDSSSDLTMFEGVSDEVSFLVIFLLSPVTVPLIVMLVFIVSLYSGAWIGTIGLLIFMLLHLGFISCLVWGLQRLISKRKTPSVVAQPHELNPADDATADSNVTSDTIWLAPWRCINNAGPDDPLANQLYQNIRPGHALFDQRVRPVGRRDDCDDVLFEFLDGSGRFAVVHLTWAKHIEAEPSWPATTVFSDWIDFEQNCMKQDHAETDR